MTTIPLENALGGPVYLVERSGSTMDEGRALAAAGAADGTVVVADVQIAGRGRIAGRTWTAEAGMGLLCTTILRYPSIAALPRALTLRVGLAVALALEDVAPSLRGRVLVKWPNDILVAGAATGMVTGAATGTVTGTVTSAAEGTAPSRARKICGVLCEGDGKAVFVGVGINLSQASFPVELEAKATSLVREAGTSVAREDLLRAFLVRLAALRDDRSAAGASWRQSLESRLFRRGEMVRFEAGAADSGDLVEGVLAGIGEGGELMLLVEGETAPRAFVAGELKVYG